MGTSPSFEWAKVVLKIINQIWKVQVSIWLTTIDGKFWIISLISSTDFPCVCSFSLDYSGASCCCDACNLSVDGTEMLALTKMASLTLEVSALIVTLPLKTSVACSGANFIWCLDVCEFSLKIVAKQKLGDGNRVWAQYGIIFVQTWFYIIYPASVLLSQYMHFQAVPMRRSSAWRDP